MYQIRVSECPEFDQIYATKIQKMGKTWIGAPSEAISLMGDKVAARNVAKKLSIPLIFSATRGVHKRMLKDLQRYTKFFAISSNTTGFTKHLAPSWIRTDWASSGRADNPS